MEILGWIIAGFAAGVIASIPVARVLLQRAKLGTRQAERRARSAERLAELGSLTGGLAHEIKNPLSTIGLNAQLLTEAIREATLDDEQRQRLLRRLDALSREVERLSGILSDFLQFAGRLQLDAQQHDLVQILDDLSDFFHPQCDKANVVLRTQLPAHPVVATVDAGLLKQALLNLMINAIHAMSAADGAEAASRRPELMLRLQENGEHVEVHVIDTGPGIPPEKIEEIFRPYVSGKRGGTGLGLPTARRIVEEHGGWLEARSEVGRGSDFVITLPRNGRRSPAAQSA